MHPKYIVPNLCHGKFAKIANTSIIYELSLMFFIALITKL